MEDTKDLLKEVQEEIQTLSSDYPEQMKGFHNFLEAVKKDGALKRKDKELIAVSLSVASHCKWCIATHVKSALGSGASKEEIIEASWVATLMGGGPSLMYMNLVLKALKDYE